METSPEERQEGLLETPLDETHDSFIETPLEEAQERWLDQPILAKINFTRETFIFILILLAAVASRLYILGARVMSHDEINHVYFAYQWYQGGNYAHNPLTHGPLQFHLLEWSYFLFNDSDFTARIPAAFFSIITVAFVFKYRRYLGKAGTFAAAFFFVISPFMLYYGRYARNESIAIFFTLATLWATLRFLDTGKNKYIYLAAAFTALHYTTKETVFIFTAQLLVFLGLLFLFRMSKLKWEKSNYKRLFFLLLLFAVILALVGALYSMFTQPEIPVFETTDNIPPSTSFEVIPLALYGAAGISFIAGFIILISGYGWKNLVHERSFGMMALQLSLVIPQLAAFPIFWLELPANQFTGSAESLQISLIIVAFLIIAMTLGMLWKRKEWLIAVAIFFSIFAVFYTTVFSNMYGIYTGLVRSLGYWLEQQGVARGSQPWYYFALVQLPIYEYLAYLGSAIVGIYAIVWSINKRTQTDEDFMQSDERYPETLSLNNSRRIGLAVLLFYSLTSIFTYMVAGEKMPWLTVHISWSMWMVTGWLAGKIIEKINWKEFFTIRGLLAFGAIVLIILSFLTSIGLFLKPVPPFSGQSTEQLQATQSFLLYTLIPLILMYLIYKFTSDWQKGQTKWMIFLAFIVLLSVSTARHAFLASYVNYDNAKEYLVYAHAARGPKDAFEEIESISLRLTGGKEIMIAFDNHTAYPFWWYLRDYSNRLEYGENPTRELREYQIILVGDQNYHLVEPIVQDDFIPFEYRRMVWPNQDYFDLNYYANYLTNSETRNPMLNALVQVWQNRDFRAYGDVTGQDTSLRNWIPGQDFRMYVRKDIAAQIWQYGAIADAMEFEADPYADGMVQLLPANTISDIGLDGPKGIAAAPNGDLYVADTNNNRIVQLSPDGEVIRSWGQEGANQGNFNQPWGVAVDQEGFVYVADTWNHRIQKFSTNGEFITEWGSYGQAESGYTFWGPRDIAINGDGNLLITDTGNKRVVIFEPDGTFITSFGSAGYQAGEFDEPVGIAVSPFDDLVYVADTWNQRVQVFSEAPTLGYYSTLSWDIDGWFGQSLENKPYLTVDTENRVIVVDPESARVLVFNSLGEFINGFGEYDPFGDIGFGYLAGVASDPNEGFWLVDSTKNAIYYFILSPESVE